MNYTQQLILNRYKQTPEYRMEVYMAALYECGEALY